MRQITITLADDGQITVEADGQEPYQCASSEECLDYLEGLIGDETQEREQAEMAGMNAAKAWNEEAAKRPQNPNLMG